MNFIEGKQYISYCDFNHEITNLQKFIGKNIFLCTRSNKFVIELYHLVSKKKILFGGYHLTEENLQYRFPSSDDESNDEYYCLSQFIEVPENIEIFKGKVFFIEEEREDYSSDVSYSYFLNTQEQYCNIITLFGGKITEHERYADYYLTPSVFKPKMNKFQFKKIRSKQISELDLLEMIYEEDLSYLKYVK